MKTTGSREAFPSPLRLVIYLALIAAFCALNCLTVDAKSKSPPPTGKVRNEILFETLPGVLYSQPPWFVTVYLDIVLQPIYKRYAREEKGKRRIKHSNRF
jgi:hypothetical protein